MSYGVAAALQAAIFQRLTDALPGVAVHDALPQGQAPVTFVLIGPEVVADQSDRTGRGAEHRVTVSVISREDGFLRAKSVAVQVGDALTGAALVPARGRVVGVTFLSAEARRLRAGEARRVDLRFRIRVED